jgi:hypothetical protein
MKTYPTEITSLEEIIELAKDGFDNWTQYGYVNVTERGDLLLFDYTTRAHIANRWNFFERVCRGLIINKKTGEIVARPFDKFFYWLEGLLAAGDDETHRAAIDALPPDLRDRIAHRLVTEPEGASERELMFADCMARIASRGRFRRLRVLTLALQDAESRGDVPTVTETKRQIRQLNDQLSEQARRSST